MTTHPSEHMTPDLIGDVEDFHHKFDLLYDGPPRMLQGKLGEFRLKFLREEIHEYSEAMYRAEYDLEFRPELVEQRLEQMLDALVDEVYVAIGTAVLHGFNFREAWRRVHEANMHKVRATKPTDRGGLFDVVKPDGWVPPSHADLVANHAHVNHHTNGAAK